MEKIKMVKLEDGNYIPEECYTIGRKTIGETTDLPCAADCYEQCRNCIAQKVMNAYGELEEDRWIPVTERLPEEHNSIFKKFKGTPAWKPAMFEKVSPYVLATVKYEDGTALTEYAHTIDGKWKLENPYPIGEVIAWMSLPEPYKE